MQDIHTVIANLHLDPHPEGGFYKEMYRSETVVKDLKGSGKKVPTPAFTIYFQEKIFRLGTELNRMKLGTSILAVICSFIFLMKISY